MGEQKQIYSANQHIHPIENVKGDSVLDGFNFYKAARSTLEVRTQRERIYCCFRELVGRGTIIMADYFAPDKLIQ